MGRDSYPAYGATGSDNLTDGSEVNCSGFALKC